MLSLSRKKGESIIISDEIEIVILDIKGETARIGITAPKNISIYRKEIYEQIKLENKEASKFSKISFIKDIFKNKK